MWAGFYPTPPQRANERKGGDYEDRHKSIVGARQIWYNPDVSLCGVALKFLSKIPRLP